MMAVIVKIQLPVELLVEAQIVRAVYTTGLHTALSAVIQHGMSTALIVQLEKALMAGTARDVSAQVMERLLAEQLVVVNVAPVKLKIVMEQANAVQRAGLVMAFVMVKTRHGAVT